LSQPASLSSAASFLKRFRALIIWAWIIPPVFGLSFLLFINMFSLQQMAEVLVSPLEPGFIIISLLLAIAYFNYFARPIVAYLDNPVEPQSEAALACVRAFPLHFWTGFLLYLLVAPSTVVFSAEFYSDFMATPVDWFRIHLVALIVSIIVGLPIFFRVFDLFGQVLADLRIERPVLSIRTKVFLIGALVPLLVDTMLVQYYWTRTGYFSSETFVIWAFLQLLAVAGALIFMHSFGQSLSPLETLVGGSRPTLAERPLLRPQSMDELGVLAHRYQRLLSQLYYHGQIMEVGTQLLRGGDDDAAVGEAYDRLVAICREALDVDASFLMLGDETLQQLSCVAYTGQPYKQEGHFSISLDEPSMSVLVFREGRLTFIDDVANDTRVSPWVVKRFNITSAIGAPLAVENRIIGTLLAVTQKGRLRRFSPRDCDLMTLLAHEAALVVHTQRLQQRRRQAEAAFREASALARVTLQSIGDGVIATDCQGRVEFLNPVAEQLTGWRSEEAKGEPLQTVFRLMDEATGEASEDPVRRCLQDDTTFALPGPTLLLEREGRKNFAVEVRVSPLREEDGRVRGVVLVFHDTTELAVLTHRLSYQATHDALTGLVNRHEFEARLELALESCRLDNIEHALCFMDLDQFKIVNDTCGHVAGDELLKQLAARLRATIREADTVARLGGDEFGLLLEGCHLERALAVAENVVDMTRQFRFLWGDKVFDVGISIGLVPITAASGNITDILSAADSACYVAKGQGRNRIHVFEHDDLALAKHRSEMQWLQRIRRALENDDFQLYGQPIRPLLDDEAAWHNEVLLRLREGNGDLVLPGIFLPAAERYHLMPAIDRWVVQHTLAALRASTGEMTKFQVSINLSAQSLCDDQFLVFVMESIRASGVAPAQICFEITETTAIANLSRAMHFISELKKLGCRFALDDFGSGLSSFAYLKSLPVDYLKIDGSFVMDLDENLIDRAMVNSINEIGHLMGIKTVAEFVSSERHMQLLREIGVDFVQGFYISKPKPLVLGS
jgi:diguanylate cyclase (GGDEF)-like protein/PAS domain S-box-containing protein